MCVYYCLVCVFITAEFNLRHFSTIWSCGKLQCGILTSRRRINLCVYCRTYYKAVRVFRV